VKVVTPGVEYKETDQSLLDAVASTDGTGVPMKPLIRLLIGRF